MDFAREDFRNRFQDLEMRIWHYSNLELPPRLHPVIGVLNDLIMDVWRINRDGNWQGTYHGMELRREDRITAWMELPLRPDGKPFVFDKHTLL